MKFLMLTALVALFISCEKPVEEEVGKDNQDLSVKPITKEDCRDIIIDLYEKDQVSAQVIEGSVDATRASQSTVKSYAIDCNCLQYLTEIQDELAQDIQVAQSLSDQVSTKNSLTIADPLCEIEFDSQETIADMDNPGPVDESPPEEPTPPAYEYFFNLTINGETQKLENKDSFVGCNNVYGSGVLEIIVSGSNGTFLDKTGKWQMSFPLLASLGDNESWLFSDAYNPIGMPTFEFTASDAPIEYVSLPIGLIPIPQVTHSLVATYNDPNKQASCSIHAHKRGAIKIDYGKTSDYGVRKQYREFDISCFNYIAKDKLIKEDIEMPLGEIKLHFSCQEIVYY